MSFKAFIHHFSISFYITFGSFFFISTMKKLIPLCTLLILFSFLDCANIESEKNQQPIDILLFSALFKMLVFLKQVVKIQIANNFRRVKVDARSPISLGLVDKEERKIWIFEATPDFKYQLRNLTTHSAISEISGIFLTHAHIGHYTGLIHLGHEVMGTSNIPVYTMPRMKHYLKTNGPWSQLVDYQNIQLVRV